MWITRYVIRGYVMTDPFLLFAGRAPVLVFDDLALLEMQVRVPFAMKLLADELLAMGIVMRIHLSDNSVN